MRFVNFIAVLTIVVLSVGFGLGSSSLGLGMLLVSVVPYYGFGLLQAMCGVFLLYVGWLSLYVALYFGWLRWRRRPVDVER